MNTEAIILAGGFGTRLKSVVHDVPKPMAPVAGKPFLYYILNYLQNQGIKRTILSVGYKREIITGYFGNKFRDISIGYATEDTPLGTGGGILNALRKCTEKQVFIVNGDTFFPVPLNELHDKHIYTQAETTIALKQIDDPGRYGTVCLNSNSFITSFKEKNESSASLINGGIYLVDRPKIESRKFNDIFSFEKDYLEQVVKECCIAGCIFSHYFLDIGIPESYRQAQKEMLQFV